MCREACAVCNLDVLAEPDKWDKAVRLAVREIRRLGLYGLSDSELSRYITAMMRGKSGGLLWTFVPMKGEVVSFWTPCAVVVVTRLIRATQICVCLVLNG
jgi:hypothetical protein